MMSLHVPSRDLGEIFASPILCDKTKLMMVTQPPVVYSMTSAETTSNSRTLGEQENGCVIPHKRGAPWEVTRHFSLLQVASPLQRNVLTFRKEHWKSHIPSYRRIVDILYHDEDVMIISKPPNFLVDGDRWSVQEYLQRQYPQYPLFHLIHQIDHATSGIFLLGLHTQAASRFCKLFSNRWIRKEYVAIVHGWMKDDYKELNQWIMEDPIQEKRMGIGSAPDKGKLAETVVRVRRRGYLPVYQDYPFDQLHRQSLDTGANGGKSQVELKTIMIPVTYVHLYLKTGRRHQLRVHLSSIGHPIVGDILYEEKPPFGTNPEIQAAWSWKESIVFEPHPDPVDHHNAFPVLDLHDIEEEMYTVESNGGCRMLLHSRFVLLPIHDIKTKHGQQWDSDMTVQVDPVFQNWVHCCCEAKSVTCNCSESPPIDGIAVDKYHMELWKQEREKCIKGCYKEYLIWKRKVEKRAAKKLMEKQSNLPNYSGCEA
jgi:23S rRNA-/tRNA-specific pseudouridylate synthase